MKRNPTNADVIEFVASLLPQGYTMEGMTVIATDGRRLEITREKGFMTMAHQRANGVTYLTSQVQEKVVSEATVGQWVRAFVNGFRA